MNQKFGFKKNGRGEDSKRDDFFQFKLFLKIIIIFIRI